jgi:hypothetical protein
MIHTGDSVSHKDMARVMFGKPVSAGFIDSYRFDLNVYGESVSLGLKSREVVDKEIINSHLFNIKE